MRKRTRKLIGTISMLVYVCLYAPLAMRLAESRIQDAPEPYRMIAFVVLGLIWIVPLMPLIKWMERPD